MIRLLCFGDLHLSESAPYGPPGEFLREQEKVLERIVRLAVDEQVDAVLFAGDGFEKRRPSPAELLAFSRPLGEFLEDLVPMVAVSGNHDCIAADAPMALDIFDGRMMLLHRRPGVRQIGDVSVAFLPWAPLSYLVAQAGGGDRDELFQVAAEHLIDIAAGLREQIDGPAVLLGHWSVSGSSLPSGLPVGELREVVLDLNALIEQEWDAVILAHIHRQQVLSSDPFVAYVGSAMPLNFGEERGEHGCWIVDLDGHDVASRFVPVESRPFVTVDLTVEPEHVQAVIDDLDVIGAIVRVRYTVTREQAARVDQAEIRRALLDAGAWHVQIEADIVREQRARVAGLGEDADPIQAMGEWLTAQGIVGERVELIQQRAREYMEVA